MTAGARAYILACMKFVPTVCLLGAATLAASCSFSPSYSLDESLAAHGVSAPAAPASWRLAFGAASGAVSGTAGDETSADIVIRADAEWGATVVDAADTASDAGRRVVAESYYAIAADWLDPRESVDPADMGLEAAVAVAEPLEAIRLPRKALAYGGLYPGDPGYPLLRRVVVSASVADGGRRRARAEAAAEYLAGFPEAVEPAGLTWLGAVGDVMPGKGTSAMLLEPDGPDKVFKRALPVMRGQDLLVANLETAVTDRGVEWPKTFRFRMPAAALEPLLASGIDVVSLANNHVFDYTEQGFSDTLDALKAYGLPFVGAGNTWDEAVAPFAWSSGGERVTLWALGAFPVERTGFYGLKHASVQRGAPGLLWADEAAIGAVSDAMRARRSDGGLLVVAVHAGLEYTYGPYGVQTDLYRRLIDAGADVVLGHHPHVLQPMEWYAGAERSGLIVYSLGNFVFDDIEDNPKGLESMLLSLGVSGGAVRAVRVYPARMDGYTVDLDDGDAIRDMLRSMSASWNK